MALLVDGVRMVMSRSESDEASGDIVWLFKTSNPLLEVLNQASMEEWLVGGYEDIDRRTGKKVMMGSKKHYRVQIPHTTASKNNIFQSRDDAIEFVNGFIRRYK